MLEEPQVVPNSASAVDEPIFEGDGPAIHLPGSSDFATMKKAIGSLVWKITNQVSLHDIVEVTIQLSGIAMSNKLVRKSLPDRYQCNLEQRLLNIDKAEGPQGATEGDQEAVYRHDVVKFEGSFWRVVANSAKHDGSWGSCASEDYKLMLQAITVDEKATPIFPRELQGQRLCAHCQCRWLFQSALCAHP